MAEVFLSRAEGAGGMVNQFFTKKCNLVWQKHRFCIQVSKSAVL